MLRKTEHRRASMKRSKSDTNNIGASQYNTELIVPRNSLNPKTDFNYNDGERVVSPVQHSVKPLPRTKLSGKQEAPKPPNGQTGTMDSFGGVYVQEEIHPGVVLQGYAVDI